MRFSVGSIYTSVTFVCILIGALLVTIFGVVRSLDKVQETQQLRTSMQQIDTVFAQLPATLTGQQTDALEVQQLAEIDQRLQQSSTNISKLLRANIALRLGDYQQVDKLIPEQITQLGLFLQGNSHALKAYELVDTLGSGSIDPIMQATDRAQEYFSLAANFPRQELPATTIATNYQFAVLLEEYVRLQDLLDRFARLFDLFREIDQYYEQFSDMLTSVLTGLKDRDLSDNSSAQQCKKVILSVGRTNQKELATFSERIGTYKTRTRRVFQQCINSPKRCEQLDQFFTGMHHALGNISLALQGYIRTYQRIDQIVKRRDVAGLEQLCAQGSEGRSSQEQQMLQESMQQLEKMLGGSTSLQGQQPILPDELHELRNQYEEYIPEKRDEQMIEHILERQEIWRQEATQTVQEPGYSFDQLIEQLFNRFYGNVQ